MRWATVLLLLSAVFNSQSFDTATATGQSRFDFAKCKERLCFEGFGGYQPLYRIDDKPSGIFFLVIWPYEDKKWRVTMETAFDAPEGITLQFLDKFGNVELNMVTCAKSGSSVAVSTTTLSSILTIDDISGSHGHDHFNCEFDLKSTSYKIMDIMPYDPDELGMRFGKTNNKLLIEAARLNIPNYHFQQGMCDPSTVKHQRTHPSGQHVLPVISDRFSVTCPYQYALMWAPADESKGLREVTAITCDKMYFPQLPQRAIYLYKITPLAGEKIEDPYMYRKFRTHCARKMK